MSWFERFCFWFVDVFGSPTFFAVCALLLVVWLAPIPAIGWQRWNASWGLLGNTSESTAELFLAVATLYTAKRIDSRHEQQLQHIERILEHLEEMKENA